MWLSLHLFHHGLVLHVHASQLLADAVVHLEKLCDAAVQTDGLSLAQVSLVVLWGDALLVARARESERWEGEEGGERREGREGRGGRGEEGGERWEGRGGRGEVGRERGGGRGEEGGERRGMMADEAGRTL